MFLTLSSTALTASRVGHDEPPPPNNVSHRQKAWDVPRIMSTYDALLEASPNLSTRARLLAVATRESGVWLNVLPVSSLGLCMDNDVIRVDVGLRLGAPLCEPHNCLHCRAEVDSLGTHGLSCRYSKGHHPRHATLNEEIKRALGTAKIPSHLEPSGFYRTDGKRPDGASIVPWRGGKVLVWDVTCPDTLAPSYSSCASREAGIVAEEPEGRKKVKYTHLETSHCFIPIAIEMLGVFGPEARQFVKDLGCRIEDTTLEPLSIYYLKQRIAVAVQRGNAAAIFGTSHPWTLSQTSSYSIWELYYTCDLLLVSIYV